MGLSGGKRRACSHRASIWENLWWLPVVEPKVTAQGPRTAMVMYCEAALGTTGGVCLEWPA